MSKKEGRMRIKFRAFYREYIFSLRAETKTFTFPIRCKTRKPSPKVLLDFPR